MEDILYLRTTDNYEDVLSLETLSNATRLGLVSEVIMKPTTDKTVNIIKSRHLINGIYYHKDIMDKILDGKTQLNNENTKLIEKNIELEKKIKILSTSKENLFFKLIKNIRIWNTKR